MQAKMSIMACFRAACSMQQVNSNIHLPLDGPSLQIGWHCILQHAHAAVWFSFTGKNVFCLKLDCCIKEPTRAKPAA
jgi:hypothetical protein